MQKQSNLTKKYQISSKNSQILTKITSFPAQKILFSSKNRKISKWKRPCARKRLDNPLCRAKLQNPKNSICSKKYSRTALLTQLRQLWRSSSKSSRPGSSVELLKTHQLHTISSTFSTCNLTILCVNPSHFHVAFFHRLFQLRPLDFLLLFALFRVSQKLLGREFEVEQMLLHLSRRHFADLSFFVKNESRKWNLTFFQPLSDAFCLGFDSYTMRRKYFHMFIFCVLTIFSRCVVLLSRREWPIKFCVKTHET